MAKDNKVLSAAVESDSNLANEFEEYREEKSMASNSEAVRHLIRAGLEAQTEGDEPDEPDAPPQTIEDEVREAASGKALQWATLMMVSAIVAFVAPIQLVAWTAISLSVVAMVLSVAGLWFDIKQTLLPRYSASQGEEVTD